jgi:predicted phosphoribosyltransferase
MMAALKRSTPSARFAYRRIPVAPPEAIRRLAPLADRVECLLSPRPFWAVGAFYDHFDQVTDDEVIELLKLKKDQ